LISSGDLIYNSYNNIFEPVEEVKFKWISYKKYYSVKNKKYPNIRFLDVVVITKSGYVIYDFDYRLIEDSEDFNKTSIPKTTLKVWI
jgi:hypothetical protein